MTTACNKGFTLLEIMVALAVLAIVLASLFRLQSSTVELSRTANFRSLAPILARQALALLADQNYSPNETSGEFEDAFTGYSWDCELDTGASGGRLSDFLSQDQADRLVNIRLAVYSPGKDIKFTLQTWRFINDK